MSHTDNHSLETYLGEIARRPLLTDEQESQLATRIAQGDAQALDELTTANLRYVVTVARQYAGRGLSLEDLVSEGNIGLMKAATRFNPARGKRFVTFAAPFIREALERALSEQTALYKVPVAEATRAEVRRSQPLSIDAPLPEGSQNTISLLHVLEDGTAPKADEAAEQAGLSAELTAVIGVLSEREQQVVRGCYGVGGPRLTMAEIGADMGLHRERVRQIRDKALRKLRKASRQGLRELR